MGLFGGDKKKGSSDSGDTAKKLKQKKKTLGFDQQIADLQLKKANAAGDRGSGEAGDGWTTTWWNTDLDP